MFYVPEQNEDRERERERKGEKDIQSEGSKTRG